MGLRKQVFHIPGNYYVYPDAKALCKAYGADLANYDQIEEAYKKGGEWCSYGWSEGQMAYFPTQKSTWNKLQTEKGHENDCGRPGINGGYIDNPAVRFGANCYGIKPQMTEQDEEYMNNYRIRKMKNDRMDSMETDMKNIKNELDEIKSLLLNLTNR